MPTECRRDRFGYEVVEGRQVVVAFDGGQVTSDAGALLRGATKRALGLVQRLARGFTDDRAPELVEHTVETMLMQRICGVALGGAWPRAGAAGPVGGPRRPRSAPP